MKRSSTRAIVAAGLGMVVALVVWQIARRHSGKNVSPVKPGSITIDYPAEGSVFPPEFPAPTWLWRDAEDEATSWVISIAFSDGAPPLRVASSGERMRIGESDPRCVSPTNKPPTATPEQAAAHTWTPDAATWSAIKAHSVGRPATIVITGHRRGDATRVISRGQVSLQTSRDPVGAPIFYRDVPLMPSESEKGVIKPLAPQAVPLIAWRLRSVGESRSRLLMEGLHTCANCHSFSADGKTLGMDMDGPQNEKGLYAIVKVQPQMAIRNEDLVTWSTFRGKLGSKLRVGFMSQVSPDARYVITTVNDPGIDQTDYQRRKNPIDLVRNYYVANFRDYRFLQVFYPTRGVLAWYSPTSGHLQYLPGADDTRFVHANAVWSPDGKSLVFLRAQARDAYPGGTQLAEHANDPKETQIKYDLYRIPFNGGKGGKAEPIAGASRNGMSNSFPKISPDGRWIVYVQSRNGMLMRPDGQLYIVPAGGGTARRMKCNTPLMNSWHSFSPNGRWLVFSSKSRSPYTQMFLTHIDEAGNDSPAILIENATAANRAVNIPEFVKIPPDGMMKIDTPAADYALHMDLAIESMKSRKYEAAVREWTKTLALAPREPRVHNGLGVALSEIGKVEEAIAHYREAVALSPQYAEAHNNLGDALARKDAVKEAVAQFEKAVQLDPGYTIARANLGMMLARTGQTDKAIVHMKKVVEAKPDAAEARRDLGHALADKRDLSGARVQLEEAVRLSSRRDPLALHILGRVYADLGRFPEAVRAQREALVLAVQQGNAKLVALVNAQLDRLGPYHGSGL
ncbi:MAG: tetratricopeptide repeat protein [Deltaproteobacteria bacterium]|nr:tetratricopeptide repeat protein [Deltaproteobacteria bacterium]